MNPIEKSNYHQTEKAVNNRGNTCKEIYKRLYNLINPLRAIFSKKNRCQKPDRHTDSDCSCRNINTAHYHWKNSVFV